MVDWFRSWHGAPTDPKWLAIGKKAGVVPGIAVAVAWALMDRASQSADRGSIEGYDAETLACFFGCEPEQIDAVVNAMEAKGMIVEGRFSTWEKRQPEREDGSAERAKAWRERKRTQENAPEESRRDTELEPEKKTNNKLIKSDFRKTKPESAEPLAFPATGSIAYTAWEPIARANNSSGADVDVLADAFRKFCKANNQPLDSPYIPKSFPSFCRTHRIGTH